VENEIERKVFDRLPYKLSAERGTLLWMTLILSNPWGKVHRQRLRQHLRGIDELGHYERTLREIKDNRNRAVHDIAKPYTLGDLNRLRKLLFETGFLREFMNGIQPR